MMKRRTLDIMFSTGGIVLAGLLLVLGLVLASDANFAHNNVSSQLRDQQIRFKSAADLSPAERQYSQARSGCLIKYAGQLMTTGHQAKCWADEYMAEHLKDPTRIANANGMTYAQLGDVQAQLRTQIAAADKAHDPALPALQKQLADVTTARDTVFKGEMQRGVLLTTYGFSVLGNKARQVSNLAFVVAGVLALLSIAGFVHALRTPETVAFAAAEPAGQGFGPARPVTA